MIFSNNIYQQLDHFGLNINPNSVRIIKTDKSGKITHQAEELCPQAYIVGDSIDQAALTQTLTTAVKTARCNTAYAAVCFPENLAFSRKHTLPKLPLPEVTEAIRWQLGTIFPFKPEDIYFDWKLLSQSEQETKVVVTAANKKLIEGVITACREIGVKPISFESSASALSRAIQPLPDIAIMTEIDGLGSSVTLVEKGISSLTITASFLNESDSKSAVKLICQSINQLLERLPSSTAPEIPIYITGEKSSAKLAEILSTQVGKSVKELILGQIPASFNLAYMESHLAVDLPESEKTINLLPDNLQHQYRQEAELNHAKKTTIFSTVMSGFACLFSIAVLVTVMVMTQNEQSKLASIGEPPPIPAEMNVPLLLKKAQKIISLQPAKKVPTEALDAAVTALNGLPVRQLDYNASKKEIKISLGGMDRSKLFEIKDVLEKTGKFNQIAIPLSALGSEEAEAITLTLPIKGTL